MPEPMSKEHLDNLDQAWKRLLSIPSEERTGRPLTPNDPATIAMLVAEVRRQGKRIEKLERRLTQCQLDFVNAEIDQQAGLRGGGE